MLERELPGASNVMAFSHASLPSEAPNTNFVWKQLAHRRAYLSRNARDRATNFTHWLLRCKWIRLLKVPAGPPHCCTQFASVLLQRIRLMCYPRDAMVASHRDPADRLMVRPRVRVLVDIFP